MFVFISFRYSEKGFAETMYDNGMQTKSTPSKMKFDFFQNLLFRRSACMMAMPQKGRIRMSGVTTAPMEIGEAQMIATIKPSINHDGLAAFTIPFFFAMPRHTGPTSRLQNRRQTSQ